MLPTLLPTLSEYFIGVFLHLCLFVVYLWHVLPTWIKQNKGKVYTDGTSVLAVYFAKAMTIGVTFALIWFVAWFLVIFLIIWSLVVTVISTEDREGIKNAYKTILGLY